MTLVQTIRAHWPEYLIEAWALGTFMLSAATFGVLIDAGDAPLRKLVADDDLRRVFTGAAMGLTAIAIIYSPWGRRSGAHMNPAVTLTFLALKRIAPADAALFICAQIAGGLLGVLFAAMLFGERFTGLPVNWVQTQPGPAGIELAFLLEFAMAFGLMTVILALSSHTRWAPMTGIAAGIMVASYISLEAPFSGMSINPARTLASALPAGASQHLWLYAIAPPLGMLLAGAIYRRRHNVHCAKLIHTDKERCIHCGYEPPFSLTSDNTRSRGASI